MYDIKALYEAQSVQHAIELLTLHPEAKIIAGGSDVLIQMREGRLAGCELVFPISSYTGEGIPELLEHLAEEADVLPWHEAKKLYDQISFRRGDKEGKDLGYRITQI